MRVGTAIALIHVVIVVLSAPNTSALPRQAPLTKQEIISMLKQSAPRKVSQAEIVAEVEQRGISFAVNDKVLGEMAEAGARSFLIEAIKRAGKSVGRPEVNPSDYGEQGANRGESAEELARLPLVEQARRNALAYADELPNFIVTQAVSRYVRTPDSKDWKLDDTLEIELTYREGKGEQYKLLRVNGKAAQQSYESIAGSTSTGELGTLLASVFLPQSKAVLKEVKRETINGRQSVVYDFSVKKENSRSIVADKASGQQVVAGYSGSVWIDTETKQVLRIESANEGMPTSFPVTLSEAAVDYDWVSIAGERYLLPVRAEVLLGRDSDRIYTRNTIDFKNYKKFEAKIKVPEN